MYQVGGLNRIRTNTAQTWENIHIARRCGDLALIQCMLCIGLGKAVWFGWSLKLLTTCESTYNIGQLLAVELLAYNSWQLPAVELFASKCETHGFGSSLACPLKSLDNPHWDCGEEGSQRCSNYILHGSSVKIQQWAQSWLLLDCQGRILSMMLNGIPNIVLALWSKVIAFQSTSFLGKKWVSVDVHVTR